MLHFTVPLYVTPRCGAGLKTCCFFSLLFFSFSISEELQNSFHIFFLACFLLVIYLFLMRERKNNNIEPIEPNALSVLKWHRGRTQGRISAEITAGLNAGPRPQRFVPRTHSDPPAPPGREWGRRPREGSAEGGELCFLFARWSSDRGSSGAAAGLVCSANHLTPGEAIRAAIGPFTALGSPLKLSLPLFYSGGLPERRVISQGRAP